MEPHRLQHTRHAACAIAQQYSSATFVSLCLPTPQFSARKNSVRVNKKKTYYAILTVLNYCIGLSVKMFVT